MPLGEIEVDWSDVIRIQRADGVITEAHAINVLAMVRLVERIKDTGHSFLLVPDFATPEDDTLGWRAELGQVTGAWFETPMGAIVGLLDELGQTEDEE